MVHIIHQRRMFFCHAQVRASVLTASQCATYDEVKRWVMARTGWADNAGTHLGTALITGLVSTTATSPVDVVKTNMFVGEHAGVLSSHGHSRGTAGITESASTTTSSAQLA